MIDDLKFALLNLSGENDFSRFVEDSDGIFVVYKNIVLKGTESEIFVYYDPTEMGVFERSKYLSKSNTIKSYVDISAAINYLKYLSKVKEDITYELYHYFLFKIQELKYTYDVLDFNMGNDRKYIRCDISGLKLKGIPILFNILFIAKKSGMCRLEFYPKKPLWNEGKICPENEVNKIIDYVSNLSTNNYKDIALKEQ